MIHLLESSRVFPRRLCGGIPWFPVTNRSSLAVFWLNPVENTNLENSWNLSVKTPKSMLVIYFSHLCKVYWWFVMNVNYCQQTPLYLGFYLSSIKGWITQDTTLGQGINIKPFLVILAPWDSKCLPWNLGGCRMEQLEIDHHLPSVMSIRETF